MKIASTLTVLVALLGGHAHATGDAGTDDHHQPFADPALGDTWIDGVDTTLLDDLDRDGYASSFSVELDVDSVEGPIQVFARLSLSGSDGHERLLYDTGTFTVDGRSYGDRLDVELTLLGAFPSDHYALVVELRDAHSNRLLDVVDGRDFVTLSGLTLEDRDRDPGYVDDYPHGGGYTTELSVSQTYTSDYYGSTTYAGVEYAGAQGPLALLGLTLLAWMRTRHRSDRSLR